MFYAPILDEPEILVDLAWNIPPRKQNNIPNRQEKRLSIWTHSVLLPRNQSTYGTLVLFGSK
jgi:hypothetical protein